MTLAFKKYIAEFVGFPTVRLAQHQKAVANLRIIPELRCTNNCNCEFCLYVFVALVFGWGSRCSLWVSNRE